VVALIVLPLLQITGIVNIFAVSDYHTGINPSTINNCDTERFWQDYWQGKQSQGQDFQIGKC
jgi:hypothetical protein